MLLQCVSLLLPVAATCGWYAGRKEKDHLQKKNDACIAKGLFSRFTLYY